MSAVDGFYTTRNVECQKLIQNSDINLKNITANLAPSIYAIASARSVIFAWKRDGLLDCGCIAQDWQNIIPLSVTRSNRTGYLSLDYGKAALISVISVARKTCEHESRIQTLERENRELKERLALIEN